MAHAAPLSGSQLRDWSADYVGRRFVSREQPQIQPAYHYACLAILSVLILLGLLGQAYSGDELFFIGYWTAAMGLVQAVGFVAVARMRSFLALQIVMVGDLVAAPVFLVGTLLTYFSPYFNVGLDARLNLVVALTTAVLFFTAVVHFICSCTQLYAVFQRRLVLKLDVTPPQAQPALPTQSTAFQAQAFSQDHQFSTPERSTSSMLFISTPNLVALNPYDNPQLATYH